MPETLDTLATKIVELGKAIDARFAKVDQQFAKVDQQFAKVDQQFAKVGQQFPEVKSHLEMKIEALRGDVHLVYDAVIAQQDRNEANDRAHERFTRRLDDHEVRILALEPPKPAGR